jgi:hypothetical protein
MPAPALGPTGGEQVVSRIGAIIIRSLITINEDRIGPRR